jgi:hypothetical protein
MCLTMCRPEKSIDKVHSLGKPPSCQIYSLIVCCLQISRSRFRLVDFESGSFLLWQAHSRSPGPPRISVPLGEHLRFWHLLRQRVQPHVRPALRPLRQRREFGAGYLESRGDWLHRRQGTAASPTLSLGSHSPQAALVRGLFSLAWICQIVSEHANMWSVQVWQSLDACEHGSLCSCASKCMLTRPFRSRVCCRVWLFWFRMPPCATVRRVWRCRPATRRRASGSFCGRTGT